MEKITMKGRCCRAVLYCILAIYCLFVLARLFAHPDEYQWDFKLDYYAAKVYSAGQSPYDAAVLSRAAGEPLNTYNPPAFTLLFFAPFSLLSYDAAYCCFLIFKCVLLAALICLWRREFLDGETGIVFYLVCLFGFRSALYLDVRAGNVNLLEQFLLWLAFSCYLRRKLMPFCVLILIGATFKVVTALFLGLLLLSGDEGRYRYLFGSLVALLAVFLASYVADPRLFKCFVDNALAKMQDEGGLHQPSTLAFLKDVSSALSNATGLEMGRFLPTYLFMGVAAAVAAISWRAYSVLRSHKQGEWEKTALLAACVVYALVLPRFKDYYYVLLIVPTYYIIARARRVKAHVALFILVLLPSVLSRENPLPGFGGFDPMLDVFWEYYPLIIAYCIWGLYLYEIFASPRRDVPRASPNGGEGISF
jgi:hypothetical protein